MSVIEQTPTTGQLLRPSGASPAEHPVEIATPRDVDAVDVHDLIASCPPLDPNSLYANLLQCTHFAQTCALARRDGQAIGWVSGYLLPGEPHTYFLWQVAVHAGARGQGLPQRLIDAILSREACRDVRYLKTTITPGNVASWALFHGVARRLGAPLAERPMFDRQVHFGGHHDSEVLATIGPFEYGPLRSRHTSDLT